MSQSRRESLIEALINTAIGFLVNFCANLVILPLFGFTSLTAKVNLLIGILYTLISVVRGYAVRRWFNSHIVFAARKLAGDSKCN